MQTVGGVLIRSIYTLHSGSLADSRVLDAQIGLPRLPLGTQDGIGPDVAPAQDGGFCPLGGPEFNLAADFGA